MSAITEARDRFVAIRPELNLLAGEVEVVLARMTRERGIACHVSVRVKEISSFVGKALRRNYTDPWAQITDKVGARVTLPDATHVDAVVDLVKDHFEVTEFQDKTRSLWNEDKVGYGGVHLQVNAEFSNVVGECEIQVRSAAQNLWSEMSHRLLYKPGVEISESSKRALVRLAALIEIFDEEVKRGVDQMLAAPGYEVESLVGLAESELYKFSDTRYDRSLSKFVLGEIGACLPAEPMAVYADALAEFTSQNFEKLTSIYRRYDGHADPVLLHQPEALVVFERLANAKHALEDVWSDKLPVDEFEALSAIWG